MDHMNHILKLNNDWNWELVCVGHEEEDCLIAEMYKDYGIEVFKLETFPEDHFNIEVPCRIIEEEEVDAWLVYDVPDEDFESAKNQITE